MAEEAEVTDETVVEEVTEEVAVEVDAEATTTEETTVDDEDKLEAEASEPSPETEPKDKPDKVQQRIDELTSDIYDLRADRDHWRNQAQQPEVKPEPVVEETEKTLESFGYDEAKYAAYNRELGRSEAEQTFKAEADQQTYARKESEFRSTEAKFARKNDDYYAVTNTPGLEISPALSEIIKTSEMGPEVFYHLGNNLGVASKISRMDYPSALREVIKLEGNLSHKPVVEKSKAPPPAPKIEAVDEKVDTGPGKSQDSFEKWRAKYRK